MQRAITHLFNKTFSAIKTQPNNTHIDNVNLPDIHLSKMPLLVGTLLVASLGISGCQTISNVISGDDDGAISTASQTDAGYYAKAAEAMDKGHYLDANDLLTELRTFYPTGRYAEQALLDLMYSQFQTKEYELAANNAELFISLYPNNPQVDYAYYVRGVANMQTGSNTLLNMSGQNLAHRDNSYMRLAFSNFQDLLNRFPTSPYSPDAAQRMNFIYNQFAESEITAARWYIKRDAYVAAANRARWVFQYYPLSEQTPEAIAILAYSYDQLGTHDLAQKYKTLLEINYPEWLTQDGNVRLHDVSSRSVLNTLTFGKLGRASTTQSRGTFEPYTGETRTQVISRAAQLQLAQEQTPTVQNPQNANYTRPSRNINLGLSIPESDSEQIGSQSSSTQTASNSVVNPDNFNPTRRTTLPVKRESSIAIAPQPTPSINPTNATTSQHINTDSDDIKNESNTDININDNDANTNDANSDADNNVSE